MAKGDPEEATVLAALHHEIAALPESAVILAEDEAQVNLLHWLRSTKIVKGQPLEVMTPGKNQKRSIFGAIEVATGRRLYHIAERANSATFIECSPRTHMRNRPPLGLRSGRLNRAEFHG